MSIGIIFDFDGTIIDSEANLYRVINRNLEAEGHGAIEISYYKSSIGTDSKELDEYILSRIGKEGLESVMEEHLRTCLDLECNDHITKLITFCEQESIPMAVATSSYRKHIEPMLKNLGLYDKFVAIRGREDVEQVKPDPALYQLATEDLNIAPENIFAIEDTVNGALAAEGAGLNIIVLTSEITNDMDFNNINYYAKDIPYEEIVEILKKEQKVK
jgi:beta-phosphoglucomutase-like phosphatase (HAD superfamily)